MANGPFDWIGDLFNLITTNLLCMVAVMIFGVILAIVAVVWYIRAGVKLVWIVSVGTIVFIVAFPIRISVKASMTYYGELIILRIILSIYCGSSGSFIITC